MGYLYTYMETRIRVNVHNVCTLVCQAKSQRESMTQQRRVSHSMSPAREEVNRRRTTSGEMEIKVTNLLFSALWGRGGIR